MFEVKLDGLPPGPNETKSWHWTKRNEVAQYWRQYSNLTARNLKCPAPLPKALIHYHISVGDNRRHDSDNLVASLKNVQDGLSGVLIVDDNIDVVEVSYSFDRAKPRGVVITVTPKD